MKLNRDDFAVPKNMIFTTWVFFLDESAKVFGKNTFVRFSYRISKEINPEIWMYLSRNLLSFPGHRRPFPVSTRRELNH